MCYSTESYCNHECFHLCLLYFHLKSNKHKSNINQTGWLWWVGSPEHRHKQWLTLKALNWLWFFFSEYIFHMYYCLGHSDRVSKYDKKNIFIRFPFCCFYNTFMLCTIMQPHTIIYAGFWTVHSQQAGWSPFSLARRTQHPWFPNRTSKSNSLDHSTIFHFTTVHHKWVWDQKRWKWFWIFSIWNWHLWM